MSATDQLVENARRYAETFDSGDLPRPPAKKVAVVTCMDARIDPLRLLGLAEGDANVLRNAGGVVTDDQIRTLSISQRLLGTEEIILIHHTDCGMLDFTDEEYADQLESETGVRPDWDANAFDDLAGSVRESIARIRESPFVPNKGSIRGFVYDVHTGCLDEIEY